MEKEMRETAMSTFDLKGKSVVITGASSGMGKAAALAFAGEGARPSSAAKASSPMAATPLPNDHRLLENRTMPNAACVAPQKAGHSQDRGPNPMPGTSHRAADPVTQRLLGTWRLAAFTQNGRPHPVYGRAPSGTIRYEADGNMAVQIMPELMPLADGSPSPPAETHAIPGYIAYFGAYRVDSRARTVAHDRLGNVTAGEARTVVRHYEFLPDGRLALTLDEDPTAQVLWQRMR